MKSILFMLSCLVISSCGFSSDKIDYDFSSKVLFLNKNEIKKVSKIEVYSLPKKNSGKFTFGVDKSTKNHIPIKIYNGIKAQEILNLLSNNTGSVRGCSSSLSNYVLHFIIRLSDSDKVAYFLAQACSPESGNTAMLSYMYPDGDNATAYSTAIYELISNEIIVKENN